jgi:hypothetical protein
MDQDIPKISGEKSYGDGGRQTEAEYLRQGKERSYYADREAHPRWSADQCGGIAMMAFMHLRDDWKVVKDEAVQ